MEPNLKENCDQVRVQILNLAIFINSLHAHPELKGEQSSIGQHSEMHANITLAYRHMEDARMRLGKVLQARDGGESCYDK